MSRTLVIRQRLRRGGTAEIFEAEETQEGGIRRRVVVKRLLPELQAECGAAFLDEARLLAQLAHPGVVRLLGTDRLDGDLVQILEPVDGKTVREWSELGRSVGQPMPFEVALHVLSSLAETLSHVHEARDVDGHPLGIVHRDLSPNNVMLSRRGEVKLLDFGVSRALRREARTQVGVVRGTPGFLSPEQHRGRAIDPRSDLYGLGLLAWYLFEGRSPTEDPHRWDRVLAGEPILPPVSWSSELREIVSSLLDPEPSRRPSSAAKVARSLHALVGANAVEGSAAQVEWLSALDRVQVPNSSRRPAPTHPLEAMFAFSIPGEVSQTGGTHRLLGGEMDEPTAHDPAETTGLTWVQEDSTEARATSFYEATNTSPTDEELLARPSPIRVEAQAPISLPPTPILFTPSSELVPPAPTRTILEPVVGSNLSVRAIQLSALALLLLVGVLLGRWLEPKHEASNPPEPSTPLASPAERSLRAVPAEPPSESGPSPVMATPAESDVVSPPPSPELPARRLSDRGSRRGPAATRREPAEAVGSPSDVELRPALPPSNAKGALDGLAREIRLARDVLSSEEIEGFERTYFELRSEYKIGLDPEAERRLEHRVTTVLEALSRAKLGR